MNICAALACRAQSSRLYCKPLQTIEDRTVLSHLIFQLRSCKKIGTIVLAIAEGAGNEAFVDAAKREGCEYIFGDMDNVTERLVKAADHVKADQIVRVTTENPLIYKEHLDDLITKHISGDYDYSNTINLPDGAHVEVVKKDALIRSIEEGSPRHRHHAATLYILENQKKFKILKEKPPKELQRKDIRLTIDLPEDLILFRKMYKDIYKPGKLVKVSEAVHYLDAHPEVKALNSWLVSFYKEARIWD